jgi:hypothetical protein
MSHILRRCPRPPRALGLHSTVPVTTAVAIGGAVTAGRLNPAVVTDSD